MSVEVHQLSRHYGGQKALDRVSFRIGNGQLTALLGPNGAGKTSLMRILVSYLRPDEGRASICGLDVQKHSLDVRRRLGYLAEHNPLDEDMYVMEYLEYVGRLYGLKRQLPKRLATLVDQCGLGPETGKKIGMLSKGYRQRLGLAQALIHDPEVLILDEPTTGLDPNQLHEIRQLIRETGKHKTLILSTHILQEVKAICDHVLVLHQGRLVADAPMQELFFSGRPGRWIELEFNRPPDADRLAAVEGVDKLEFADERHCRVFSSAESDCRPALFQFAVDSGLLLLGMQARQPALEDVFAQLTRSGEDK